MTKPRKSNAVPQAARGADNNRAVHGSDHDDNDSTLVPLGIRLRAEQMAELRRLASELEMDQVTIIRRGVDLGIEWAKERLAKLG